MKADWLLSFVLDLNVFLDEDRPHVKHSFVSFGSTYPIELCLRLPVISLMVFECTTKLISK